jgi:predicted nucleic acid-binding protein
VTVVDASVWVSRLVPQDVHHAASRGWLEEQAAGGNLAISPTLLLAEVAGAVSRRTGHSELAHQAVQMLLRLTELRLVPLDSRVGRSAAQLAAETGLRGADAVYVATAHHLSVPLVTLDRDQQARAGRLVEVRFPEPRGGSVSR